METLALVFRLAGAVLVLAALWKVFKLESMRTTQDSHATLRKLRNINLLASLATALMATSYALYGYGVMACILLGPLPIPWMIYAHRRKEHQEMHLQQEQETEHQSQLNLKLAGLDKPLDA